MRATIKDVSKAAGVSVATVSNVRNAPELVAPATRERVKAVIEQLGYQPNQAARALQKQRTLSIGYGIPTHSDGFALDVFLHNMAGRAVEADLHIVLFTSRPGQSELDSYREMIQRAAVDGFVLSGTRHDDQRIAYLLDLGVPFVTFGRTDAAGRHAWVDVDGRVGVGDAVAHLVDAGHGDIALIAWPEGSISGDDRCAGYADGLGRAGISLRKDLVVRCENDIGPGHDAMAHLLAAARPPTAVIAVSDGLALGAMAAAREAGLVVGRDLAVIGFDDTPTASVAIPPLTSIRQPMEEIGRLVVELLVERLDDNLAEIRSEMVRPDLIVRESSAARVGGQ